MIFNPAEALRQPHLLVAGTTGSGKSVKYDRLKYYETIADNVTAHYYGKYDSKSREKLRKDIETVLNALLWELDGDKTEIENANKKLANLKRKIRSSKKAA